MRTFIEVRNEQLKSECRENERVAIERKPFEDLSEWKNEETWQKVATRGEHEAWVDIAYGLIAYYNSKTEYCAVATGSQCVASSEDGKVMVLNADRYALPGSLYALAE